MNRLGLAIAASALVLAACASAPEPAPSAGTEVAVASSYELGMQTASELQAAGNVQTAIQRLMQLAGDPSLTADEKASVLYRLGTLSAGPGGYDLPAAEGYFNEILVNHPGTQWAAQAEAGLAELRPRIEALNGVLASPDSTPGQRFNALMQLGRHLDAIDLMTAHAIDPDNDVKLAMYDIGYLCEDEGLTGQRYMMTDRDGTMRTLHFCDYGK